MNVQRLRTLLDDPESGAAWLAELGSHNAARSHSNLVAIANAGVTLDLLAVLCDHLSELLPRISDPDMALNNIERYVLRARSPLALGALFQRDPEALQILIQLFSTSQYLSDLLIGDPESFDLLRVTEGQPVAREVLVDEIWAEVQVLNDARDVSAALNRLKRRETLRISYGDLIREQRLETVTRQISCLAEAILEVTIRFAIRQQTAKRGTPRDSNGRQVELVALGMGKLGGLELNYSSDIDLIFIYESEGTTDGSRSCANSEFFASVVQDVVKLLTESSQSAPIYRVDLRLRPDGAQGPPARSLPSALRYYDMMGRTWERQAYVKARPVAGNLELGEQFLNKLEPWIYRRYLNLADITGIKALKRRIEKRARVAGQEDLDVKSGHGGIRDIEFAIQFLQLLNGGDLAQLRTTNTLEAIASLENVGCLTNQERELLSENYRFLRNLEHRLQIMFDLQTHVLPTDDNELRKIGIRMGYPADGSTAPLEAFQRDYKTKTGENRKVLDHLLHDAFGDDAPAEPEVNLVLDPDPPQEQIVRVMEDFGFKDPDQAYRNLMELAEEKIRFLSTRRCRHFLAAIAPGLLKAIARRADPDSTLTNLCKVSDSLGGKGVLWELFSFNPPTLQLYIELCASPFLSNILISHPGMIDELMDSLMLNKLAQLDQLESALSDLSRKAEDTEPILHSFKNAQLLRVGVRDILGKEDVITTTAALSDIAEACLREITRAEYRNLVSRLGEPIIENGPRAGHVSELFVVAMGKFGGRELNYHSDLDIIFLYEAEGTTQIRRATRRSGESTTNQHFFDQLGQRIIKTAGRLGPLGRLYEIDPRLRPTGRNGPLATSLAELTRYFADGDGQLWERLALCRARVVIGNSDTSGAAMKAIANAVYCQPWQSGDSDELIEMRKRLEDTTSHGNLKRGRGGIVDIEFITQMLQLRYGYDNLKIRQPNTATALASLGAAGILKNEDFRFLDRSYRLLRSVESRLRLMNTTARDDLPDNEEDLTKLAQMLGHADSSRLLLDCEQYTTENRRLFERFFSEAASAVR